MKQKKTTEELMEIIKNSKSSLYELMDNLSDERLNISLTDYLNEKLAEKDCTISQIAKQSTISAPYIYQLFSGERTNASRDKILALAFSLELSLDDTQQMLKIAGLQPLYPRVQKDLILIYALNNRLSLIDVNEILEDLQETLLK